MKAFVRTAAVTQEVKFTEVPLPQIASAEVLIKVEAFGVGIHDRYFIPADAAFPYVIGSEGAGIITQTGAAVTGFEVGDRVVFTTILQPQGGSWAEYAVAKGDTLISLPAGLSFAQGAALPIAGKTALECMRELHLKAGETLFVAGASGAIGTFVVQLAVAGGIRVAASASSKNAAYLESLGVEKAVDYHNPDWQKEVLEWSEGGVTAALAIQPGTGAGSLEAVRTGGTLITVSGDSATVIPERNIRVAQMGHDAGTQQKVVELLEAVATGLIKVVIEKEYPFEEALDALGKTETRHARGKLVVRVSG